MITLRPYQNRAIYEELMPWFEDNADGHPIADWCVGSGKSVMIAEICRHVVTDFPGYRSRVLMLVPSKELLEQNFSKISGFANQLNIGIVSASMGRKDVAFNRDVVIATIGSVAKHPGALGRLDLILVDECHLISRKETGQYRKLIKDCQQYNPSLRVIGFTGTPFRGNGIWLTSGDERLFTDIASRVMLRELLDEGFLSPLVTAETGIQVSGEGMKMRDGDFIVGDIAKAMDKDELTQSIATKICELGKDRRCWLVYAATVQHAQHLAEAIRHHGVTAEMVSAETPKHEREQLIRMFRTGNVRALVNVAVLTTGFDVPELDLIALARNTRSPVLYTQICGRGLRIADGKQDCLWLDFTDTTEAMGPVDRVKGRVEPAPVQKSANKAPTYRLCNDCGAQNPSATLACKMCGTEFPAPEIKISDTVSDARILSGQGQEELPVYRVTYSRHKKPGSTDSLKVTYWGPLSPIAHEWICLEHSGFAKQKAMQWWKERWNGLDLPPPENIDGALSMAQCLASPSRVTVDLDSKYPKLIRCHFN